MDKNLLKLLYSVATIEKIYVCDLDSMCGGGGGGWWLVCACLCDPSQ